MSKCLKCYIIVSDLKQGLDNYISVVVAHDKDEALRLWSDETHHTSYKSIEKVNTPMFLSSESYMY